MAKQLINLHNVFYQYEQTVALRDINLIIEEGDFLAIIGPNGSGKSTLLKIILGLLKPTKGEVFLFGKAGAVNSKKKNLLDMCRKSLIRLILDSLQQ